MLGKSAKQTGRGEDKWELPGWRIEQRYANKVLIGNWAEERLQVRSYKKQLTLSKLEEMKGLDSLPTGGAVWSIQGLVPDLGLDWI